MRPDPTDKSELAANISTRICHDLVSPVGAIVNGVDLIREIGTGGLGDEFSMISQSAERASSLLQFYRLAFGAIGPDSQDVSRDMLLNRASALISTPRVMLEWTGEQGPSFARAEARLFCLMLLCGRAVTGTSGLIRVIFDSLGSFPLTIRVEGGGTSEAAELLQTLSPGADTSYLSPRSIEFALAQTCAADLDVEIRTENNPGLISLTASRI